MAEISIKAKRRTELSNAATTSLRNSGFVPGIFYGAGEENISIAINELALRPVIYTSEANIISLSLEGEEKSYKCILKDAQFDPLKEKPIHFDFLALREGEKLTLDVSIILKGSAIGVKDGGVIQHSLHKLQIECLPEDIPSHIELDISNLKIGDALRLSDIKIEGVEFKADDSAVIVSVVPPTVDKEAAPAEAEEPTAAEPEVINKGKKEEETK